jgi:hypothetical protein
LLLEFLKQELCDPELTANARGELLTLCPLHNDTGASLAINVHTGLWCCHGSCLPDPNKTKAGGNIVELIRRLQSKESGTEVDYSVALEYVQAQGVDIDQLAIKEADEEEESDPPGIPPELVETYQHALFSRPAALGFFQRWDKGQNVNCKVVSKEVLAKCGVGLDVGRKRFTFPEWDKDQTVLRNIRFYKPGDIVKYISYAHGYGKPKLWPVWVYNWDNIENIILCEGESDTMVAMTYLCGEDGKTAAVTFGPANGFEKRHIGLFQGKRVYICYDTDTPGKGGARDRARDLFRLAKEVRIVTLPISCSKGDLSDYFRNSHTAEEWWKLAKSSPMYHTSKAYREAQEGLAEIMPEEGYLARAIEYGTRAGEFPPVYQLACAIASIGIACGNQIFFNPFPGTIRFLNTWNLLIGESGNGKSMTVGLHLDMLAKAMGVSHRIPTETPSEKLVELMQDYQGWGWIEIDEFGRYLGQLDKSYMVGHKGVLTEMYEGHYERATKSGGVTTVDKLALSIVTSTTPAWIKLSPGDLMSGFFGRFLTWVVPPVIFTKDPSQMHSPSLLTERDELVDYLKFVASMPSTEIAIGKAAGAVYKRWNEEIVVRVRLGEYVPEAEAIISRLTKDYCKKLACIHEMSLSPTPENIDGRTAIYVSEKSMIWATKVADWLAKQITILITDTLTFDGFDSNSKRITKLLENIGSEGYRRGLLLKNSHLSSFKFDEVMKTLVESGQVSKTPLKNQTGPNSVIYRLIDT